jgi:hypothetical protein
MFTADSRSCFAFIYFYHDLSLMIDHYHVMQCCLSKDRFFIMLTSYIRLCSVTCFISSRMAFNLLTDRLFIAICRSNWLYSRKHGTVWYHPASSRFYLTIFILFQFPGKIDWHASGFDARATCVKSANSACCVLGVRC